MRILPLIHDISVQNARQLNIRLNRPVLVENPLNSILIIRRGENLLHDQLPRPRHNRAIVPKVRMLEQDTGVLFVNTYRVLDCAYRAVASGEVRVEVVDGAFAVAAQGE